ncbi:MAG: hypothetical protein JSS81_05525 [Acidobacteria bacterium]|nr:hypothetical protein [Acidobacteriota bacterium]
MKSLRPRRNGFHLLIKSEIRNPKSEIPLPCNNFVKVKRSGLNTGFSTCFPKIQIGFPGIELGFPRIQLGFPGFELGFTSFELGFTSFELGFTRIQLGFTRIQLGFTRIQLGFTGIQLGFTRIQTRFPLTGSSPAFFESRRRSSVRCFSMVGTGCASPVDNDRPIPDPISFRRRESENFRIPFSRRKISSNVMNETAKKILPNILRFFEKKVSNGEKKRFCPPRPRKHRHRSGRRERSIRRLSSLIYFAGRPVRLSGFSRIYSV